ncbi:MAG: peptidase S41 [Sphingomonadales bacterium]|nr:MAG: peptidase S41 [Sphingomonadales bacterium]
MQRRQMLAALGASAMMPFAMRAAASPSDLGGDIAILREALKMHPGLYRYNSPAQMAGRIDALERAFVAAPTMEEQYLILSRFLAAIRCGHSYCNFYNQSDTVAASLFDRPTRLPFQFRWIDGAMVVTGQGGSALPAGTKIVSIDGMAPSAMLAAMMPYARADGGNDAKRVSLLEVRGSDRIEFFDVFHGLMFAAPAGGVHRLIVQLPNGLRAAREMAAIDLAARRSQMVTRDYRGDKPVWDWEMRPDGIAVLTMTSWTMYNSKWDWESWLNERLDSLKGAKGLIVDLRENEGGNQCGDVLLARLAERDLPFPPTIEKIRFRTVNPDIERYLDTWDKSFRTLGVKSKDLGDGWFSSPNEGDSALITPKGPRVTAPVAALVGPVNSSATFSFAFRCKSTGVIRLFGETTGGNRRGINGGRYFFVRLPASGIEFDLPLVGYFRLSPQPDAGVAPDVRVRASAGDIAAGRDPAIARAAAWLRSA